MPVCLLIWLFSHMALFHMHIRYTNVDHKVIILIVICKHFTSHFAKPTPQIRAFGLCLVFPYYKWYRYKYHF